MKWRTNFVHPQRWIFEIAQDTSAGYYLYIWDENGNNTHDYLQNTFEAASEQALEDFGVPLDSWQPVGGV